MSPCIILVRHHSRYITNYMGKLRFTLTIPLIWIVLILSCLLSENFNVFSTNPMGGLAMDSAFILTISTIALLVIYYFVEHKRNGLKFDKILLPSFLIAGFFLILNIFRQGDRTFISYSRDWDFDISFSIPDRILASLQVVIWLGVVYGLVFVYNRFRLVKESDRWLAKAFLIIVTGMVLVDIVVEFKDIIAIFKGTYEEDGLAFCMGNSNVWSLLIFSGVISAILLCYKKFRWQYYVAMFGLTVFNTLTTCSTTMYVTFAAVFAYTIFEIISHFRTNKVQRRKMLVIYLTTVLVAIGLLALLIVVKAPLIYNFWEFVSNGMFNKEFSTLSSRTDIWGRIFEIMSRNPLDIIFGLGHQTGSMIFQEYMGYVIKSAHNAYMEVILRYGVIGLSVYLGIIGLTVYCFIRHIQRKNYRFVFIYGLCFLCIIAHGITESTTLFTPNIGGLYFGFVFILPVLNILQEKRFNEIKEDLLKEELEWKQMNSKPYVITSYIAIIACLVAYGFQVAFHLNYYVMISIALGFLAIEVVVIYLIGMKTKKNIIEDLSDNLLFLLRNSVKEGE